MSQALARSLLLLPLLAACNHGADFTATPDNKKFGTAAVLTTPLPSALPKGVPTGLPDSGDQVDAGLVFSETFQPATIANAVTRFKPNYGLVEDDLTLREAAPLTATLTQKARPVVQQTAVQGDDGTLATVGPLDISSAGKLDIVVVIDNSDSMASYQDLLSTGLGDLLASVRNTDWQLVVGTSTDTDPCYQSDKSGTTVITRAMYEGDVKGTNALFQRLATVGTSDASDQNNERLLYGAARALDPTLQAHCTAPANWPRPDSAVAIFMVSDEDNCHASGDPSYHHSGKTPPTANDGCTYSEYTGADLKATLAKLGRTPGVDARLYGIYWRGTQSAGGDKTVPTGGDPVDQCKVNTGDQRNTSSNQGFAYDALIPQMQGASGSICLASYDSTLQAMSANVAGAVKRQFTLDQTPIPGTLVVVIDGVATTQFTLTGTTLTLTSPPVGAKSLSLSYRYAAVAKWSSVQLAQAPVAGSLQVYVNNQLLDPSEVQLDPATNQLTFLQIPPDSAAVRIDYRTGALPNQFDVSGIPLAGATFMITLDGVGLSADAAVLDSTGKTLTFKVPPTDGATIIVSYHAVHDKITTYPVSALADVTPPKVLSILDEASKLPVAATASNGQITFAEADVSNGRVIQVTFDYGDPATALTHELTATPLPGTVHVFVDDGTPDCIGHVVVTGAEVSFACASASIGEVAIAYQYLLQMNNVFTLSQTIPAGATASVYVDGQKLNDATQQGGVFTVPMAELTPTSDVKIVVSK